MIQSLRLMTIVCVQMTVRVIFLFWSKSVTGHSIVKTADIIVSHTHTYI